MIRCEMSQSEYQCCSQCWTITKSQDETNVHRRKYSGSLQAAGGRVGELLQQQEEQEEEEQEEKAAGGPRIRSSSTSTRHGIGAMRIWSNVDLEQP